MSPDACLKSHIVSHPHFDCRLFHAGGVKLNYTNTFFPFVSTVVLCTQKDIF